MSSRNQPVPLLDADFERLRALILGASGLHFAEGKKYLLESRLQARLEARKFGNFAKYLDYLESPAGRQEEMTQVINQVTTNETSFYRNAPQISAFQFRVLPELIAKRRGTSQRLRVWSAGCSSGEEPYTLAIAIREAIGAEIDQWRVDLLANDISAEMLAKAKLGEYDDHTMRATPLEVREKYFERNASGMWVVNRQVRGMVQFFSMNLKDAAAMRLQRGMDVVFCRNVLIYLEDNARRQVLDGLIQSLAPGGWLFLGHSETAQTAGLGLELVRLRGTVAYRRGS